MCLFVKVLTLHLDHIHRNLLLPHTEDFKVGDHTLKWIHKWLTKPFTLLTLMPSLLYSTCTPAFPSGSCPPWHTGSLRSSASAACSQQRWRGSGRGSLDVRASASKSLWLGCLCPLVPKTLWCCRQETRRSPWRDTLKFNTDVLMVYILTILYTIRL